MAKAVLYQAEGTVDWVADADVSNGTIIAQGELVGIVQGDVKSGQLTALATEGIFEFPAAAEDFAVGDIVYYDGTPGDVTATATDNVLLGVVAEAAASAEPTVRVKLRQ